MIDDAMKIARAIVGDKVSNVSTLAAAVTAQDQELRALREFIEASKECADAASIQTLVEENDRMRAAVNDLIDNLQKDPAKYTISSGMCSWCNEKWLHLDGKNAEEVRAAARFHAYRCVSHPLRIERDMLLERMAALKTRLVNRIRHVLHVHNADPALEDDLVSLLPAILDHATT